MSFSEKLSLLMTTMGISNSKLAKLLSVDTSLVSRWRTGKRTPIRNKEYIRKIATYFAEQAQRGSQRMALYEIMGFPSQVGQRRESLGLADALYKWLSDEITQDPELIEKLVSQLNTFNVQRMARGCLDTDRIPTHHGKPKHAEVFYGNEGKRQAAIKFLSLVKANEKACTLLLHSDESIEWLTKDEVFLAKLTNLLFEVIAKGNHIKIVHVISRDIAEILTSINFWLPFYMTGVIEPYYCPKHREYYFRRTMFIAPGVAALTSTTLAGQEENAPNFLYTDLDIIGSLTKEFNEFLKICRPLMRIFTENNFSDLNLLIAEFEEQRGDHLSLSNTLSCATMPEETFSFILNRNDIDNITKERMVSLQQTKANAFLKNVGQSKYVEIVNLPCTSDIKAGRIPIQMPNLFYNRFIFYKPEEYKSHLIRTIDLLKSLNNYELYICARELHKNLHIDVKDEIGVIVAKTDHPPIVFAINQQNMINAFYWYLEGKSSMIPHSERNKKEVINKLQRVIQEIG